MAATGKTRRSANRRRSKTVAKRKVTSSANDSPVQPSLEDEYLDYFEECMAYLDNTKRPHTRKLTFFRGAEALIRVMEERPQDLEKVREEIDRVLNEFSAEMYEPYPDKKDSHERAERNACTDVA